MGFLPAFLSYITIAIAIGLPALIFIQLFRKRYTLKKIPSLKIWKSVLKISGAPPKTKVNLFNFSFLIHFLILCLIALLCASPVFLQKKKSRPNLILMVNRSTSMNTKSGDYNNRWERLQKTVYNKLIENQYRPDDQMTLLFNPPLAQGPIETEIGKLNDFLESTMVVDIAPSKDEFYKFEKYKGQCVYVSDSIKEVPVFIKDKISVIYIQDNEHINVGWVEFWFEDQIVCGVIENFSNYPLNVNIDLKLNGISIPVNDFAPAIQPRSTFLFQKKINENLDNIQLIEATLTCPGDCLEADNIAALSRLSSQNLRVIVAPEVPMPLQRLLAVFGNKIDLTIGKLSESVTYSKYDLCIDVNYHQNIKVNQLVVQPSESTSFYKILKDVKNGEAGLGKIFKGQESQLFDGIVFEGVHEIKEDLIASKLLMEKKSNLPLVLRWKILGNSVYLLNFNCSEVSTITKTPAFPFLIAKVIDEMNLNQFLYFKSGEILNYYDLSSQMPKVFQSNRKTVSGKIDFENTQSVKLNRAGIFSNENHFLCVNLLNEKESDIKQELNALNQVTGFSSIEENKPIDLKPYFFTMLVLLFLLEWVNSSRIKK